MGKDLTGRNRAKVDKKRLKAEYKLAKKSGAGGAPAGAGEPDGGSRLVHFAEGVRGVLAIVFALSLVVTLLLPDRGFVITLNELIRRLIPLLYGRIILGLVAAAFVVYGLKCLRAIR